MKTELMEKYAGLILKTGLNLQKGQSLVITCPVECADFARLCTKTAYDMGAREVILNWIDDFITRQKYLKADSSVFDTFPAWRKAFYDEAADGKYAWLRIDADDPESLSGVDPDRILRSSRASAEPLENFRDKQMVNYFKWCIASVPSKAWAKRVFPDLTEGEAMESLWQAILSSVRVNESSDPVSNWKEHISTLKNRVNILNSYRFRYLHYKNSLGTDLKIELPPTHFWEGGSEKDSDGADFCANMPTEEIYTVPKKDGVNGIVYSSKPLSINGNIAENFSFRFENGKIVEIKAEKGLELLKTETSLDAGASYLGEVALVPYNSPISNSGILFYNTLFDENASCHLAFGDSYPLIEGGRDMTKEELKKAGINSSITHTDFMVGTADLSITGITWDGEEIEVFKDGNFTF